nr:hypothetical protein [Tanacetum cinerariifolium]
MHKAFLLPGESSHWQYKFPLPVKVVPTARRLEMPLPGVYTAIEEMMKKLPVKDRWQAWRETLILGEFLTITFHTYCPNSQKKMDHQYPTVAKIPVLDTGKFEQWQFRIQQYLQHEHYALWEVIEFDPDLNFQQLSSSIVANQIQPLGFDQPNVQKNQNQFSQPQGYNRGNNFNQDQSYQTPTQQNQVVPLSKLEKIKRMNEANMKAMQTLINNVKNELRYEMKNSIQALMSNQTNELKNMMASFFQMNTASTSGSGPLPSNTIANSKGELKAITTRSGIVLDGPFVPIPPPFINPEEDERVEETLTDQDLTEDPLHPNIPYPSKMHKQKQQEKDEVQVHKFWQMFKQLCINITLADALILIPKYHKILKALFSNKEKLLELANTPLNKNCLAVILTKLPEKLRDPGKFLISCSFSELKCKALFHLGARINLMPLSVWKNLGLPELISTQMTLELANQAICTPAGIARDVFVLVRKFTFPADFFIVDYESDPRFPLILGRPFLGTAHALIDIHEKETILRDDLFATNHQSANLTFSSHLDLTSMEVKDDIFDPEGGNVLIKKVINLHYTKELPPPPHNVNLLSGSTFSSSLNHFLEEFADELALITFTLGNDDLPFDIESDLKEIEYFLSHDPINEMDSILKDSVDEDNLADLNDNLVDTIPEMFTDEHALDYSSLLLYDEYDDDVFEVESSDFFPSPEYDSFLFKGFSKVDALPSTENKDKVFNPAISHASLILEDFDPPPLYELPFLKEVLGFKTLLSFSSENKEKVFKPGIITSKEFILLFSRNYLIGALKFSKSLKFLKAQWIFFLEILERTSASWMFLVSISIPYERINSREVIEFGDSYKVPTNIDPNDTTRRRDDEQSRRTVTITTEDMQRKKNDVKARTTLLLSLPDEHQLRFSKYKTAIELWTAILKTFGGNEATKKRKKNLLKQQYGNFKAEGSENLEQMFNRLQVIMMHTIVWRNKNDLDTMSLDDLYNHLKVYEAEVQTKSNSQNMAFISSSKNISGNEDGNISCVSTASTTFPTGSVNVATISHNTASAYIASQSNGSQIKFEDINQIDEDDMEEMDIKWSMALLSMRADKAPRSQERERKESYRQGNKTKEKTSKALMAIDGVGWDWSDMANKGEDHALVADGETPTEFALMANTESKVFDNFICSNDCKKNNDSLNSKIKDLKNELSEANNYIYHYKLAVAQLEGRLIEYKEKEVKYIKKIRTLEMYRASNLKSIKALDKELEEVKEGVGYNAVPPPAADLYLSPKKDLSWTGLPEFGDDTVTDYSRPSTTVASTSAEDQIKDSSTSEDVASPNPPKPLLSL